MAVAFRSKSETVTTATDATPAEPAGAALNDVFVALLAAASTAVIGVPAGWTELFGGGVPDFKYSIAWIRRGSSAPSLTWTTGGSVYREVHVLAFSGCVTTGSPIDNAGFEKHATGVGPTSDTTDPDPPAIYAVDAAAMAVALIVDWAGTPLATGAWVGPTGYTIRSRNTPADDCSVATKLLAASGIENPSTVTGRQGSTSANKIAATITLTATAPPAATQNIYAPCLR